MADKNDSFKKQDVINEVENTNRSEWVSKLRYSRSFMSKLIVSKPNVKDFYASLATKLLSYDKVKSRVAWSGINFVCGKKTIAKINFSGKTLCLFLAIDPSEYKKGRYSFVDVRDKKRYAQCPAKIKITSGRALTFALETIEKDAEEKGFSLRIPPLPPILAKDFPTDKFDNLIARGLIRVINTQKGAITRTINAVNIDLQEKVGVGVGESKEAGDAEFIKALSKESYRDTLLTNEALIKRHDEYAIILDFFRSKTADIKLIKKYIVKTIDEKWITAIEDCLDALDECVRKPSHFIEETEELLPIERTKKVTPRSIRHLCEHTDLIAKATDDEIVPTHLLNIFRDDSLKTYENKFINTLLRRLYVFVNDRYNQALQYGANEKISVLSVSDTFNDGPIRGNFSFKMEISEPHGENVRTSVKTKELWRRVVKLKGIVGDFFKSELAVNLGNTFIFPPVVRTNAILKNPNLRQCLTLWEFIESYEDEGNGIMMEEKEETLSQEHIDMLYHGLAEQYLVLRYGTAEKAAFVGGRRWSAGVAEPSEEKTVFGKKTTSLPEPESNEAILFAVEAAVCADQYLDNLSEEEKEKRKKEREELLNMAMGANLSKQKIEEDYLFKDAAAAVVPSPEKERGEEPVEEEEEKDEDIEEEEYEDSKQAQPHEGATPLIINAKYRKSFEAKLRLSDENTKKYYCDIYNAFLSKDKVWVRKGYDSVTFNQGRKTLARAMIVGRTLRMYFAIDVGTLPDNYRVRDCSDVRRYSLTPAMLKIRSDRSFKIAMLLIEKVCEGLEENKKDFVQAAVSLFGTETVDKLIEMGLMERIAGEGKSKEISKKRDLSGAGGDALVPSKAATALSDEKIVLLSDKAAQKKNKPEPAEVRTEPAGGDALSIKPITLDEIVAYDNSKPKVSSDAPDHSVAKNAKESFWSKVFKRKK